MIKRSSDVYFTWLCDIVGKGYFDDDAISYKKLLTQLHEIDFICRLPMDNNRADDGKNLRYRFESETGYSLGSDVLTKKCSVLEMMVALATRAEQQLLDDPLYGDRTEQWFTEMIINLGLGSMTDMNYDEEYVDDIIDRFLKREYEPDGRGGLFRVKNCEYDMRDVEIWTQLAWYIDNIM